MSTKVKPGSNVSTLTKLAKSLVKSQRLIVSESGIGRVVESILGFLFVFECFLWGGVRFPGEFGVLVHPRFWLGSLAGIALTPLGARHSP